MIRLDLLSKGKNLFARPAKKFERIDYGNSEFYREHPDLMPRNIYLATGRVITKEQIDDYFEKNFRLTFSQKCKKFLNKIIDKFKQNNSLSEKSDIK